MIIGIGNTISKSSISLAEWTPADISGGHSWYKHDEGITIDGSSKVLTWDSQIGSGNQMTSESGTRPLYSAGTITFGGLKLDFPLWSPGSFSAYFVCKVTAGSIINEEIINYNSQNFIRIQNEDTFRVRIGSAGNNDISVTNTLSTDTWMILGVEWLGETDGTINVYQDTKYDTPSGTANDTDTLVGFGGTGASSGLGLRGSVNFGGDMKEIVFIDNELTTSDRNSLMTYLKDKHSI